MEGLRCLRISPLAPVVSSSTLYDPRPGSMRLFFDIPRRFNPVALFQPNLAPGRTTSVGLSKLCHETTPDGFRITRFPLFRRVALVFMPVSVVVLTT
ncbi:Os04g0356800 [Oryza sativa Japonica Group]|uniref:Os04g0356800 protein n=1 Tax=Oryza sativa subsp. japonica TaxID=39947 RepID=A0A0P0W9C8_ORYSJ|nr:hypothetical protein EE612_023309 [Oryza sativa]BAS88748.1 Os04g0356800 [Oryza sativa Japonica Group]